MSELKYNDRVKITKGFFAGVNGKLIGVINDKYAHEIPEYSVLIDGNTRPVWLEKKFLEIIPSDSDVSSERTLLISRIEKLKEQTQRVNGTFKYDQIYDEVISIIKEEENETNKI